MLSGQSSNQSSNYAAKMNLCSYISCDNLFSGNSLVNSSIISDEPIIIDENTIVDKPSIIEEPSSDIYVDEFSEESIVQPWLTIDERHGLSHGLPKIQTTSRINEMVMEKIICDLAIRIEKKLKITNDETDTEITDTKKVTDKIEYLEVKKSNKKIIFAVDNDECIGSWGDLSLIYSVLKLELGIEPNINLFVEIMVKTGCIRPYVKDFFAKLLELKKKGIIYKIFMFTAASDSTGWVTYLSKVIETWFGESVYDGIIYGEMIKKWHTHNKTECINNLGYVKNMDMLREIINYKYGIDSALFDCVAIDDRPGNIINGIAIGVSAFRVAINVMEVLRLYLPQNFEYLMGKYEMQINSSWETYLKNPHHYSNVSRDVDFLISIDRLEKIIFS
jgi:hypothetical protein